MLCRSPVCFVFVLFRAGWARRWLYGLRDWPVADETQRGRREETKDELNAGSWDRLPRVKQTIGTDDDDDGRRRYWLAKVLWGSNNSVAAGDGSR
jgi:hypothetical protein